MTRPFPPFVAIFRRADGDWLIAAYDEPLSAVTARLDADPAFRDPMFGAAILLAAQTYETPSAARAAADDLNAWDVARQEALVRGDIAWP